jgi:hypothetical protein
MTWLKLKKQYRLLFLDAIVVIIYLILCIYKNTYIVSNIIIFCALTSMSILFSIISLKRIENKKLITLSLIFLVLAITWPMQHIFFY